MALKLSGLYIDRFFDVGFTDARVNLKVFWKNPQIGFIGFRMPNLSILEANFKAARNHTEFTVRETDLMQRCFRDIAPLSPLSVKPAVS